MARPLSKKLQRLLISKKSRPPLNFSLTIKSFIHPSHQNTEHKHLKDLNPLNLTKNNIKPYLMRLKNNLITMCTPFDEESVDIIKEMNFDIIKVASCSAKDWPL